jgi:hypothetical protein
MHVLSVTHSKIYANLEIFILALHPVILSCTKTYYGEKNTNNMLISAINFSFI